MYHPSSSLKTRCALAALALVVSLPTRASPPKFVSEPWPNQAPQTRDAATFKAVMLKGHNDARRAVRLGGMNWSDALAQHAHGYAVQLARTNRFEHSSDTPGVEPQGENLWMGTRGAFSYGNMVGAWVDERRDYERGTGDFEAIGHYTQIIWRSTTKVGCAVAKNSEYEFLVCRYSPAGNIEGVEPLDWGN